MRNSKNYAKSVPRRRYEQIHYAATRGNQDPGALYYQIQIMGVDKRTSKGNTALHIATQFGQEEAVRILLREGAARDARNDEQQTPLHIAACYNVEPVVPQLLLASNAAIDPIDQWTRTPLMWTCMRGHDRTFQLLRAKGAQPGLKDSDQKGAFQLAAECGSSKILQLMIDDADRFIDLEQTDLQGRTPIALAASRGQVKAMEVLIGHDAHKNALDRYSWTPLFWAVYGANAEAVKYLIGRRVKMDHIDIYGKTAYGWAPTEEIRNLLV